MTAVIDLFLLLPSLQMFSKYLQGSAFARNVLTLVSGTALAQIINFLFTIVLTRIYDSSEYGILSLYLSIVSIVLVFSSGKFDVAMVVAREEDDAPKLFSVSMWICALLSIATLLIVAIIHIFDLPVYKNQEVYQWLWCTPLSIFLLTGAQMFWMWYVRKKDFNSLWWVRSIEALVLGIASVLFYKLGALGLLLATLLSQVSSFAFLGVIFFNRERFKNFIFSTSTLVDAATRYKKFPVVNIPQAFLDMFQGNAIILLVTASFGASVIGLYSLCLRVLQVPMRLIVLPVAHVFLSEASERFRNGGDVYSLVKKTIFRGALVALPIPVLIIIAGPSLFALVFGEEWREAGVYAQIFSPYIFLDLVRAPIMQTAFVVGKQEKIFWASLLSNILLLAAIFIGLKFFKDLYIIFSIISASQCLIALILIFISLRLARTGNIQQLHNPSV